MIIDSFDTDKKILLIAEIGNNHEGSYTLAEEMVGLAADAGVGAVKFQVFKTEYLVSKKDGARFKRLKSFELSMSEFERLSKYARKAGLLFISTPFDLESAKFLNGIVSAFKIASGDNNFYPLIKAVAETGKPLIISSGLTDMDGIQFSKALIERVWKKRGIKQGLAVLHCVSSYPVPPQEVNLSAISALRDRLRCTIGYSDHTLGIEAAVLSVASGARIVEKHFTVDKNYSDFRDHQLSADPKEMALLVQRIKEVSKLLGMNKKTMQKCEEEIAAAVRRSIVARRDLPKGARIGRDDITWIRPSGGLPPGKEKLVLGKSLSKPVKMGERLTPEILY